MTLDDLLADLDHPLRAPIRAGDVAVAVAHPDDETVGCGALLARLRGVAVILATDGSPRDESVARAHGFSSGKAYAAARRTEIKQALAVAGVPDTALVALGMTDQAVATDMVALTRRLVQLFDARSIRIVITHAYEGGHPDHDAVAFAVHAAAALRASRGASLAVVEMPYYRLADTGEVNQRFEPHADCPEIAVPLTTAEQSLKRLMMLAHASQGSTLATFGVDYERFRVAPDYDFTLLPNRGRLLYEAHDWNMTGAAWLELVGGAVRELSRGM